MIFELEWADHLARGMILGMVAILYVLLLTRLLGLRSFSKMTSFDFVITVATGSLVAGAAQASEWLPFFQALAAIGALFLLQFFLARGRKASDDVQDLVQNEPLLLMREGKICEAALKSSRVTRDDLTAKLREANVLDYGKVRAVVLETTGDVSVLHGDDLNEDLLDGVRVKD